MAAASGRFELEVVEVQNPRSEVRSGQCCGGAERPSSNAPCPRQCRTVVALCLKEYQSVAQEGGKMAQHPQTETISGRAGCTYGEDTSMVLGPSSFTLAQSPPTAHIQLPFTFSWTVSVMRCCLSFSSSFLSFLLPFFLPSVPVYTLASTSVTSGVCFSVTAHVSVVRRAPPRPARGNNGAGSNFLPGHPARRHGHATPRRAAAALRFALKEFSIALIRATPDIP